MFSCVIALFSCEKDSNPVVVKLHMVLKTAAAELKSARNLDMGGFGGRTNEKVERVGIRMFSAKEPVIEEMRKDIVATITIYLKHLNADISFQQYLMTQPADLSMIDAIIFYQGQEASSGAIGKSGSCSFYPDSTIKYSVHSVTNGKPTHEVLMETWDEAVAKIVAE